MVNELCSSGCPSGPSNFYFMWRGGDKKREKYKKEKETSPCSSKLSFGEKGLSRTWRRKWLKKQDWQCYA